MTYSPTAMTNSWMNRCYRIMCPEDQVTLSERLYLKPPPMHSQDNPREETGQEEGKCVCEEIPKERDSYDLKKQMGSVVQGLGTFRQTGQQRKKDSDRNDLEIRFSSWTTFLLTSAKSFVGQSGLRRRKLTSETRFEVGTTDSLDAEKASFEEVNE
jgi:hypothetical protein